jgi:NAD(P)-dependent dehydrogenase (short-subunit alcohol dehydrogenase family)
MSSRVVVITGGARGIGAATAARLVSDGMRAVVADIDVPEARAVADRLGKFAVAIEVDVSAPASFAALLDRAADEFGRLDVLVNNAGVMSPGALVEEADEVTRRQVDVNLLGVIYGIKLAAPRMREHGGGHIVNVASTLGRIGMPGVATYSATKHAILGLSEAVRAELVGTGVEISVVLPHAVNTDLVRGFPDPGPGMGLRSRRRSLRRSRASCEDRALTSTCRLPTARCIAFATCSRAGSRMGWHANWRGGGRSVATRAANELSTPVGRFRAETDLVDLGSSTRAPRSTRHGARAGRKGSSHRTVRAGKDEMARLGIEPRTPRFSDGLENPWLSPDLQDFF